MFQEVVCKKNFNDHRTGIGRRRVIECALRGNHRSIRFEGYDDITSIEQLYEAFNNFFKDTLDTLFYDEDSTTHQVKIQPKINCLFQKVFLNDAGDIETKFITVWMSNEAMDAGKDPVLFLEHNKLLFGNKIEEYIQSGSGWNLEQILCMDWTIVKFKRIQHYQGLGAASGSNTFQLPKELKLSRAVVNVANKNQNNCFQLAILSIIHYHDVDPRNRSRQNQYHPWKNELNFKDISFPVRICQIKTFESNNPDIAVNVFEWKSSSTKKSSSTTKQRLPIKILKQCSVFKARKRKYMVNLLKMNNHYLGIVNLNTLLNRMTGAIGNAK